MQSWRFRSSRSVLPRGSFDCFRIPGKLNCEVRKDPESASAFWLFVIFVCFGPSRQHGRSAKTCQNNIPMVICHGPWWYAKHCKTTAALDFSELAKHLLLIHHFGTHDMLVLCRDHSTGINGDQRGTLDLATQKLALGISGYSCHWVKLSLSKYYVDAIWMPSFSIQSRCNPRPSTNSGQSHILQCSARGLPSWTCTSVASLYRPYIREAQEGRNELLTKEPLNSSLPFLMSDSSGFQMNSSPVCRQLPKEQTMLLKRRTLPELCQLLSKKEPLGTASISSTNLPG